MSEKQIVERKHFVHASTPHAFWLDGLWQPLLSSAFAVAQFQVRTWRKSLAEMRMHSCDTEQMHHFWIHPTPWRKQRAEEPLCKGNNRLTKAKTEGYTYLVHLPLTLRIYVFKVRMLFWMFLVGLRLGCWMCLRSMLKCSRWKTYKGR